MNHNIVHAGKGTLYTWWKSMIGLLSPALQLQSYCAMLYTGHKLAVVEGLD